MEEADIDQHFTAFFKALDENNEREAIKAACHLVAGFLRNVARIRQVMEERK